jgi:hypothetical protein
MNPPEISPAAVAGIHDLYCRFTGQKLSLRFERERLWHEFLRAGFNADDLRRVIAWLQKEIRHQRRNIGALKLSNLLQLDRFEEDLNISRARLSLLPPPPPPPSTSTPPPIPADDQQRAEIAARLRHFQNQLRKGSSPT